MPVKAEFLTHLQKAFHELPEASVSKRGQMQSHCYKTIFYFI